jgi:large subunit ribosomal protein L6
MEKKITIPEKVEVKLDKMLVEVIGPNGTIKKDFSNPIFDKYVSIERNNNEIIVKTNSEKRADKAFIGTISSYVRNMIFGVTNGFRYEMKIIYTHFPISVSVKGGQIEIKNFLGEKGVRSARVAGDADVKVEKDTIIVTGNNIEDVSQTAANIEMACRLSKRDKRIFVDGIYITGKHLLKGEMHE